ncbi:response regulator [Amphibacillus indicireducens]|uniref:Sporulation initiation phosphotransferase Spo0F n=1 Tax=Amphibacillus indicireducens TaxID=1076330 RepID=A0ABP7VLC8_9BACI
MTKTVLIIDDQRGIRLLLEEVIRNEGYHAKSFEDGISAMAEIEINQPDLIIIDHQLPIKSGTEIIELLEEKGYQIPTIIMSGLIESVKSTAKKMKTVKAYFSKPFNIIEAKNTINQLLENNK